MCFPLFPVHVLFWFLVHRAPKRQRIYRAKFFVFFGTIRLYTKFELLMSITFFRNPLFGNRLGTGSDGCLPFVCGVPLWQASYAGVCCPTREPHLKLSVAKLRAGRRAPACFAQLQRLEMVRYCRYANDSPRLVASA